MKKYRKDYYINRINQVLEFMQSNLHDEINIAKLAQKSHFSIFHFQRIYKSITNETPYETLLRLRLEKSVRLIKHFRDLSLTQVAAESGFESYENFSRQFKRRFQLNPSEFKKDKEIQNSRIYQESVAEDYYHCYEKARKEATRKWDVDCEYLDEISVMKINAIYGQDGSEILKKYHQLITWATKHEIPYQGPLTRFGMSIDDPEVTPVSKYRYDFALSVNKQAPVEDTIYRAVIPSGWYATLHCIGTITDVAQAWDYLYKVWLPESNCLPRDFPALEEFIKGPEEIGWEKFDIKCRVPINNQN